MKLKIIFTAIIFFGFFGMAKSSQAVYPIAGRKKFSFFMFLFAFFIFSSFFLTLPAYGATINAASCSQSDVSTAIMAASSGDTVNIPSCLRTSWTSAITINDKSLFIKGAGIDITIIGVDMTGWPFLFTGTSIGTRISGITFDGNYSASNGGVKFTGTHHNARMDNNKFTRLTGTYYPVSFAYPCYCDGVVDNNIFLNNTGSGADVAIEGDADAWTRPEILSGTDGVVYVETNTFTYNQCGTVEPRNHVIDSSRGARYVFRHNNINACAENGQALSDAITNHGDCFTQSNNGYHGTVSVEIYNNILTYTGPLNSFEAFSIRGGRGVVYNNAITAEGTISNKFNIRNERSDQAYCSNCSATDEYPSKCCGVDDYPCGDQINNLYFWSNTFNGSPSSPVISGAEYAATHIQLDRDYFTSAMSGYVAYAYPHPLTLEGEDTTPPAAPNGLSVL